MESGITFADLNSQLMKQNLYVPYVVPQLNDRDVTKIQIDQAIQENRLSLQSLKYGYF